MKKGPKAKNLSVKKINFYKSLSTLKPGDLQNIITHLNNPGIESLCECVYNTIYTDLHLKKGKKNKIRNNIKNNCCRKNIDIITGNNHSTDRKRKALLQEGKGISLILSTLTPILSDFMIDLLKPK
jgi:hypothetical protein